METKVISTTPWNWLLALAVISIIGRSLNLSACPFIVADDANAYINQASQIAHFDFSRYDGYYPPGYPIFLLACLMKLWLTAVVQSLLGILTSIFLFDIVYHQTKSARWSFAVGLVNSLSFSQLIFENVIVAETLSCFLVVFAFWQFQRIAMHRDLQQRSRDFVLLGLTVAIAFLTRANLLFIAPVYLLAFIFDRRLKLAHGKYIGAIVPYALIVTATVACLCMFNKVTIDYFTPATGLGFTLVGSHSEMIQWAPDEYADFRDIYTGLLRDAREPDYGAYTWAAFGA